MAVKRRSTKSHDRGRFPEFCDRQLLEGPDLLLAGVGYFDLVPTLPCCLADCAPGEREMIIEAMRADWERKRDRLLTQWRGPGIAWAQKEFDQCS